MPAVRGCSVLPGWWKPVPDHADSGESASVGRKNQFGVWGEQPGGQTSLPAAVVPMRSSTATPTVPHPITHNVPRSRLSCGIWHLPRAPSKVIPDPHPSPAVTQRGDPGESGAPTPLRNSPRPALGLLMTVMCREEGKSQRQGVGREVPGFPHPPENPRGRETGSLGIWGDPAARGTAWLGTASTGVSPSTSVVAGEGWGLQTGHQSGHHPESSQLPRMDLQPRQPHAPAPQHCPPHAPVGTGAGSAATQD